MTVARRMLESALRLRYLLLAIWVAFWFARALASWHYYQGDWIFFEIGGRILFGHGAVDSGPPLQVYQNLPALQIGPPALLATGLVQWLPPMVSSDLMAALQALAGLPLLLGIERLAGLRHRRGAVLFAGLVLLPDWAWQAVTWRHLDDVLALLLTVWAMVLISRDRRPALAGVLLGCAVATKPWALILIPVLLAYPPARRRPAFVATFLAAAAWWLPFLVAAAGTISAMGGFSLRLGPASTLHLLGLTGYTPHWARTVELLGGLLVGFVVQRRASWLAVPLAVLAWRIVADPYAWPYYALGPLVGAAIYDVCVRRGRVPWMTVAALVVCEIVPYTAHEPDPVVAAVRLAWFVGVMAVVLWRPRRGATPPEPPSASAVPAVAGVPTLVG